MVFEKNVENKYQMSYNSIIIAERGKRMSYLDKPIIDLNGVGKIRAKQFERIGVKDIGDLIRLFPRAYEYRGNIQQLATAPLDTPTATVLTVSTSVKSARLKNGKTIQKFNAFDDYSAVEIIFFNSPYVKDVFHVGDRFRFYGKLSYAKNKLQMVGPKYEPYLESKPLADFIPIYPATEGLSSKNIEKIIASVIDEAVSLIKDPLPEDIRLKNSLQALTLSYKNAHFPKDEQSLSGALRRLAFDEMLLFGMSIALQSQYKTKEMGFTFSPCDLTPILKMLPYELTADQKAAVNDIYRDTVRKSPDATVSAMARILIGDVGCGKTVCAILAMYIAIQSGYQTALMVPTEILAVQHYNEISELFAKLGISTELLVGKTGEKQKKKIYGDLKSGDLQVVIGTHALISDKVEFKNLGLVITDEQHRFGVNQRAILKEKSNKAHMLVMSATPIPRTLALTMYGDLDISRITEMPKGRQRVDTFVVNEDYRSRLNDFILKQVELGGQCYVVCPSIEASEEDDDGRDALYYEPSSISAPFNAESKRSGLKDVYTYTEALKRALPTLSIEFLHGKMKADEKEEIMKRFSSGEVKVLVSTTVIEVGVNVPNASLMIVENAERFGLSQLHQLRGRVGRGKRKSYCVLVSDNKSEASMMRLNVMKTTYDGYEIADKDLAMRGPGDFFSSNSNENFRQSGGLSFKFAKLCDDFELMNSAFSAAKQICAKDPTLSSPEHYMLKQKLGELIKNSSSTIS